MPINKMYVEAAIEAMRKLDANERDLVNFTLEREVGKRRRRRATQDKETPPPIIDNAAMVAQCGHREECEDRAATGNPLIPGWRHCCADCPGLVKQRENQ